MQASNLKKNRNPLWTLSTVLVLLVFPLPGFLSAEEEEFPSGVSLFEKYVEAMGGRAAYDKIENRVVKATLDMKDQGMKMALTIYTAKPNKNYVVRELAGYGKMESGCNGEEVWEQSLMTGPVLKEGKEKAETIRDATFDRLIYWRKVYREPRCVGLETVAEKACYQVEATPVAVGEKTEDEAKVTHTYYFAKDSGLLVKFMMPMQSPVGEISLEGNLEDYRRIDGILIPHRMIRVAMGQRIELITESVEHNVDLPEDRFALPDAIQVLVDKRIESTSDPEKIQEDA